MEGDEEELNAKGYLIRARKQSQMFADDELRVRKIKFPFNYVGGEADVPASTSLSAFEIYTEKLGTSGNELFQISCYDKFLLFRS